MHVHAGTVWLVIEIINGQSCYHIKTDYVICSANQLTGFYRMVTLNHKIVNLVEGCLCNHSWVVLSNQNEVLSRRVIIEDCTEVSLPMKIQRLELTLRRN